MTNNEYAIRHSRQEDYYKLPVSSGSSATIVYNILKSQPRFNTIQTTISRKQLDLLLDCYQSSPKSFHITPQARCLSSLSQSRSFLHSSASSMKLLDHHHSSVHHANRVSLQPFASDLPNKPSNPASTSRSGKARMNSLVTSPVSSKRTSKSNGPTETP